MSALLLVAAEPTQLILKPQHGGEVKYALVGLAWSSRILREDSPSSRYKADFTSSCAQETSGIVEANIHLAITKQHEDWMKRILLLSILCPQFVAGICCGGDGLDTWTVRSNSLSSTNWLVDITYGNGQFVAVGGSQGQIYPGMGVILTSSDGTNWVQVVLPSETGTLFAITHAAGLYVAVGRNRVLSSLAGTSWTVSPSGSFTASAVAYGNGVFVAARSSLYISTNASTWQSHSGFGEGYLNDIAFGNGQFVAVEYSHGRFGAMSTSTDGLAWKGTLSPPGVLPATDTYGRGLFVAAGGAGAIITSTHGITWNQQNSGTSSNLLGGVYGDGVYVTVGSGGSILTSSDGVTWAIRRSGITNDLTAVAYGNGRFVAVGSSGIILESGPVIRLGSPQALSLSAVQFALTGPVGQLCQLQTSTDLANWVALTDLLIAEPNTTFVIISSNSPGRFYRIAAP